MKGKTAAKVPSLGKKRKGKGDPEFAEESKSEDATSSPGKKERLVPCFKKKKRPDIIKEVAQNKDPVVSDSKQEKCTADGNIAGTKVDKRDQGVEHKDRKDILVDDVSIFHGVFLPEIQEKEDSGQLEKGDNQGKSPAEMRAEPLQADLEQSKKSLLVKTDKYKKIEEGTDLNRGLECKDQAKIDNTSDHLSVSFEDFTSCFAQNLETEESSNDIVKESPHQKSVHTDHDMSKQMNLSESENKREQDRHQSIQENIWVISSKDNNMLKSMKEHQILCDQNSAKHIEMIGESLSFSENIIHSVNECSENMPVHQIITSSPDKHCTGLTETTKDTSSTNSTGDAETICFDNINDHTSSIQKAVAKDEDQTPSAYSEKSVDVTGQYSDNTAGCKVDTAAAAVLEKVIKPKSHDIAGASFEKAMQDTSSGTTGAAFDKPIQNTNRSVDTDCAGKDKPKTDTEMILDKTDANFKLNLTDIIASNNYTNKDLNRQFSFKYTEDTVCLTQDLFAQCPQFLANSDESDEPLDSHSQQDSDKKSQIQNTNSIHNGCILPDEVSDEMISYSPIEASEATVSQDPMTSYAEGIQVNAAVTKACMDEEYLYNTDLTDSQLCEMDWSSQIMEEENTQSMEKPVPRINLSFPQQRIPDGTNIVKGLVKELSNLNKMLLRTKREIEAARRQRGTLPSQQDKYPVFNRFHK